MNENIDLTKILEGCPQGTRFYHVGYGEVIFTGMTTNINVYNPIKLLATSKEGDFDMPIALTKGGRYNDLFNGECLFFPSKNQRDWSKFERFWD